MPSTATNPETAGSPLRVVLIEDLRDIRMGLSALINGTVGFECVAAYGSVETALAQIERAAPDIILTDLGLPGMSGISSAAAIAGDGSGRHLRPIECIARASTKEHTEEAIP